MENQFLSSSNKQFLDTLLIKDFQRRINSDLTPKQKDRLLKTTNHYMKQVADTKKGNLKELNTEVLRVVVPDFLAYINREDIAERSDIDSRMKEDIGSRFNSIQNERGVSTTLTLPPAPDFRIPLEDDESVSAISLFERAKKNRESETVETGLSNSGIAIANPTTVSISSSPSDIIRIKPALPQDNIIPQDDILSYKENEYNLVIYSADRDWYNNTRENRYNFSISFNPANNGQGFKFSPSTNIRFHNIVRIELVKAIIPNESIDVIVINTNTAASTNNITTPFINVLSLPGIILQVDELDSNVYGTDNTLDKAFGVLQYDAQWTSDSTITTQPPPGYLAMIPKFLKCQKVYTPTPLATLTKMTINLRRPLGGLINETLDTFDISGIIASTVLPTVGSAVGNYINSNLKDSANNALYYIIRTTTWFSRFSFVRGDRIQIAGIDTSLITGNTLSASEFKSYLESSNGLNVIATGWTNGTIFTTSTDLNTPTVGNSVGYGNLIVVQAQFSDPSTGSVLVDPFGTSTNNQSLATNIRDTRFTGARLINLSRQTQITFRVITRDLDSTTRIRANNA